MGRPRKYKEKMEILSIALEPWLLKELRQIAERNKTSLNEVIRDRILSSNKEWMEKVLRNTPSSHNGLFNNIDDFEDEDLNKILNRKFSIEYGDIDWTVNYLYKRYRDIKLKKGLEISDSRKIKMWIRKKILEVIEK